MSEIAKDRRTHTREEAILLQFRQVSKKQQEIADAVGVTQKTVDNRLESLVNLDRCPKLLKIAARARRRCAQRFLGSKLFAPQIRDQIFRLEPSSSPGTASP